MGSAQLVIGPAVCGKSIHIVNLDPAAEPFDYTVAMDIGSLISLDDVMEELGLGPNGRLMYCMEHLEESLDDWLADELDNYLDDDHLVFDCPGGCISSLSAIIQLELFHVNILSKMDLVQNKRDIEDYLNPEPQVLLSELNKRMAPWFQQLNESLMQLVDEYSNVSFLPLDLRKKSSISYILAKIDNSIQYGEDADVKIKDFDLDEVNNQPHNLLKFWPMACY